MARSTPLGHLETQVSPLTFCHRTRGFTLRPVYDGHWVTYSRVHQARRGRRNRSDIHPLYPHSFCRNLIMWPHITTSMAGKCRERGSHVPAYKSIMVAKRRMGLERQLVVLASGSKTFALSPALCAHNLEGRWKIIKSLQSMVNIMKAKYMGP